MAKYSRTLQLMASKLGLSEEDKVLSKAAEFERRLQMKSTANTNITDTSKVVICLELAATHFGCDLDVKQAMKYSGLKSSVYTNCKKVIENLLELNSDILTTAVLCVSLQCSGVQELANRILTKYQELTKLPISLNLPQYVCMAVYQACRISKVKISKSKFIEKSRLKPMQWTKLDAEWSKFVDDNFATIKKKRGSETKELVFKNTQIDDIEEKNDIDMRTRKNDPQIEPQIESYEEWKQRILETAYKEVKKLQVHNKEEKTKQGIIKQDKNIERDKEQYKQDKQTMTPRRSPRKTPQKFEPYKSPVKNKAIRLLFPTKI